LSVGSQATTVTVQAEALTVQADSNVVSTLISAQQIGELPMNGRNVIAWRFWLGRQRQPAGHGESLLRQCQLSNQLQRAQPGAQYLDRRWRRSL